MTGTLSFACTYLPESYQPSKELLKKLDGYEFTKRITQYHCKACGAFVIASNKDLETPESEGTLQWDVVTGSLENFDANSEFKAHIFVKDTKDGGFADFMPIWKGRTVGRWAGYNDQSEELPLYGLHPQIEDARPSTTERLHAHCKCGGIEFWIARPSAQSALVLGDRPLPTDAGVTPETETAWWLRANGTRYLAKACMCNSCRLAVGMEIIEWAFVPTRDISLDPEGKKPFCTSFGTLKGYQSSPGVTRYFCSTCAALTFYHCDERGEVIDVGVGLLDAPEGARAETWLEWQTSQVDYREDAFGRADSILVALEDGLKQYAKDRGRGA